MFKQWPLEKCPDVASDSSVATLTFDLNPTGAVGKGGGKERNSHKVQPNVAIETFM